jgi:hypothetical protein
VQPSPVCTQQRWVLMICRHWPLQHGEPPPAMHTAPRGVQLLQTPPMQLSPLQQSEFPSQREPRFWHTQRPPVHDIAPQQSEPVRHAPIAAAHAQRPPVHAAPLQQSASVMHDDSAGRHSQRRVVVLQSCQPQQSSCAMHDPPALWQQVCVPPGCIAQE